MIRDRVGPTSTAWLRSHIESGCQVKLQEKILCVDDDAINRSTFVELLGEDYELCLAVDGPDALEKLHRFRPDLVLLDIMMPGMNGYEVCQRIRETESLRHTKVIMISAKAMVAERLQGYEAGADDYMTKPFDHDELLAKIRVHLRLRASEEVEELQASVMSNLGSRTSVPMSGILGPLELVVSGEALEPEEAQSFILDAYENAKSLQELFGHVLKLTSLKSRQLEFAFDQQCIADFLHIINLEYVNAPIKVHFDVDDELSVSLDHDEMTFVMNTLIEGALSRSQDGAEVEVKAAIVGDVLELTVRDTGPILDAVAIGRAFEEGPSSYEDSFSLRRASAQYVVWAHGGEVRVNSSDENGTVFAVCLPLEPVTG